MRAEQEVRGVSKMYSLSLFFLLIFFSTAGSGSGAENEKLIEAARREGKIVWYTSVGESQEIAKAFEKKYPFLKVEVLRLTTYPLLNRILNEARAGVYAYDVLRHGAFPMNLLIQKGLVQPYRSPERASFEKGWIDNEGYWTSTDDNYFVIGYNTAMVSKADAPKDWEDLLKPVWRGKIGIDPDDHLLYGGLEEKWGEKRAGDFFRKLAQQKIQFRKGHTLLAQLIAAGEYPMGFVYAHRVELMKSQGAPTDWVSTMNPIISTIGPLALGAKPAHPNAGKLLIDFALSREGQRLLQSIYRIPSRTDMEPRSPSLNRQNLSLLPLSPSLADREQEWKRKFLAIFGLPN
jgi:iron(III) transport system substrate-binding protein